MKTISVASLVTAALILGAAFWSGCDSAGTVALTITPSYVDLSTDSLSNSVPYRSQTFTVTDGLRTLSLPLEWAVSDPSLGSIASAGGDSAAYVRTDSGGDNSITVRDQYGAEGVATVHQ